jgi:APA family basic amino acid/polyamine antiporter
VNLGVVTGNSAYLNIAQSLAGLSTSEYLGFVVGLVIILLATSVGMLGQRATYRILLVTFGIVAVAIIVYCAALLSAGPSGFQSGFDRLSGTQYNSIISAADQAGLITTFTVQGTILGSVWTMLNYLGFSNSVYVAGEIKRNETSQLYGIIGGLAVFAVVMYALFAVSYYVMGGQFINAASLLSATGSADYALPSPPVGEYLVVFANQSPLVALLVPLGVMAGALGGMVVLFPIVTRTVFAWSFDRVVPTKFCEVNSRGAPTYSILISCVVGIIVLAATFFTSFSSFLLYTVSALWINVAIVGLTAMLFPLRSKMFQDAVPAARKKIGPVPVVSIAGLITLISGVAIAYVSVNPAYNMIPLDVPLLFVPISLFVIGLVIYFVSAAYRKHQGIDLSLTFKELPPE